MARKTKVQPVQPPAPKTYTPEEAVAAKDEELERCLRFLRSQDNYEEEKAAFVADFEKSPMYALQWHAQGITQGEVKHRIVAKINDAIAGYGPSDALALLKEWSGDLLNDVLANARYGHSSTSAMSNAVAEWERMAKADVYYRMSDRIEFLSEAIADIDAHTVEAVAA